MIAENRLESKPGDEWWEKRRAGCECIISRFTQHIIHWLLLCYDVTQLLPESGNFFWFRSPLHVVTASEADADSKQVHPWFAAPGATAILSHYLFPVCYENSNIKSFLSSPVSFLYSLSRPDAEFVVAITIL